MSQGYAGKHGSLLVSFSLAFSLVPSLFLLVSLSQWGVRGGEDREHQADAPVPGCSEWTALMDRAANTGGQPHIGRY